MRLGRSLAALLLTTAAPAAAELKDPLQMTVDPADRAVMADAAVAFSGRPPDLARLDAVLAKLPRPTPLRGMVQTVRAGALFTAERTGDAVTAIEEALRLLPDDPRPKVVAAGVLTFAGSPQRAADLWLQASREGPDIARMSDPYIMSALTGRLVDLGDRARADRIGARLGELGFASADASDRSRAALARTRTEVQAGHVDLAMQSVVAIGDPEDLLGLYIDRRYEALWPRIAEWATPTLDSQSRRYLEELRRDWTAADDFDTAAPYARRLAGLRANQAVVSLFLPMFDRIGPQAMVDGAEFLAPIVARSLVRVGRLADARVLLDKVAAAMPKNDTGADLNIAGARLLLDANQLDWASTLARADSFIARSRQLGPTVNSSATLMVQAMRACALWKLGREQEAQQETAAVTLGESVLPDPAFQVHLCRGDVVGGRALILRRLADERTRDWALRIVQPRRPDGITPFEQAINPVVVAIQAATDVQMAAGKLGRILPQPVLIDIPSGFDPLRAAPMARPAGGRTA